MNRKEALLSIACVVLCVFGIVALNTFAAPCGAGMKCGETVSRCIYSMIIPIVGHICLIFDTLVFNRYEEEKSRRIKNLVVYGFQILDGFSMALLTSLPGYGFCKVETMKCMTSTRPFLLVFIPVLCGTAAGVLGYNLAKMRKIRK